jgi:hypothetical protein
MRAAKVPVYLYTGCMRPVAILLPSTVKWGYRSDDRAGVLHR